MKVQTVMTHVLNQGEESAHIRSLRVALESASEARRVAEDAARDMGYTIPDLHDDVRAAIRAEMAAYLALFDARHAPAGMGTGVEHAPVRGVSLVKAGDPLDFVLDTDAGHAAHLASVPSWVAESVALNNLCSLRRAFGAMAGGER